MGRFEQLSAMCTFITLYPFSCRTSQLIPTLSLTPQHHTRFVFSRSYPLSLYIIDFLDILFMQFLRTFYHSENSFTASHDSISVQQYLIHYRFAVPTTTRFYCFQLSVDSGLSRGGATL